jgi:hypothetical protein
MNQILINYKLNICSYLEETELDRIIKQEHFKHFIYVHICICIYIYIYMYIHVIPCHEVVEGMYGKKL